MIANDEFRCRFEVSDHAWILQPGGSPEAARRRPGGGRLLDALLGGLILGSCRIFPSLLIVFWPISVSVSFPILIFIY